MSYFWAPKPPARVRCIPPSQEFFYQPPAELYVYQPPAEEVLVEQPPELDYLPPPEAHCVESPVQRYLCHPPPQEYRSLPEESVFWIDPRTPPISYGVRAIPTSIRIFHPRELPIKR